MREATKTGLNTRSTWIIFWPRTASRTAKKKAVFLAVIGPKVYKLLGSMVAPGKLGDKSYADLVKLMLDHHNPKTFEIVQRYKFHTLVREPRVPIAKYVCSRTAFTRANVWIRRHAGASLKRECCCSSMPTTVDTLFTPSRFVLALGKTSMMSQELTRLQVLTAGKLSALMHN